MAPEEQRNRLKSGSCQREIERTFRDSDSEIERLMVFWEHKSVFFFCLDGEEKILSQGGFGGLFADGNKTEALSSNPDSSFSEHEDHFVEGINPCQDM